MDSSKIIVLITGANQGIGLETAKNLVSGSAAYHVILGSRDLAKGEAAAASLKDIQGTVSAIQLDVTSDSSVDSAAISIEKSFSRLDILINNAGVFSRAQPARAAFREVLNVNTIGALSTTEAFLPLLRKSPHGARLVFVSSSVGSISQAADPGSKYHAPLATEYRASKAAVNMLVVQYHVKLAKEGIKVHGADPGLVATNFVDPETTRKRGAVEPEVGGERIAVVVKGQRDEDVGKVCGEYGVSPW